MTLATTAEVGVLTAGLGGLSRQACVALAASGRLLGVCGQERVTRVRGAGFNPSGVPDQALDLLLERLGRSRQEVARYAVAEGDRDGDAAFERIDHHLAHACAAYLTSPFSSAAIVVCDHEQPKVSVWDGDGASVTPVEWPWRGPGFADVYGRCARVFGFGGEAGEQRLEALARLTPDSRDSRVASLIEFRGDSLSVDSSFEGTIEGWLGADSVGSLPAAALAAALQAQLVDGLLQLLAEVRRRTGRHQLCLAGSLFYHSSINTAVRRSALFSEVFVPVDPGNAGLAVGTALHVGHVAPQPASPFLGPAYTSEEAKETLDNCKLAYDWESEDGAIAAAARALVSGTLVGWFDGAMEWGPRALGARCILANPFSPYVLENLNHFLKHRDPWRGYAIAGLEERVAEYFEGPARSPFMEGDYRPGDPARFRHVLPHPGAAIRVQTVGVEAPPRFKRLLEAFEAATGLPFLVNTSFNGFHEPIVCSPRDAVRVFYGSGLDLLVLDRFLLEK